MKKFSSFTLALGVLLVAIAVSLTANAQAFFNLGAGWRLLGNAESSSLDVATTFGGTGKINTVWKWSSANKRWALYMPSLTSTELTTYAQAKGYDVLTSIAPKEGFWVNAATEGTFTGPISTPPSPGSPVVATTLLASDLLLGWNLVASTDVMMPSQLNASLNPSLTAQGKSIVSIWAFDAVSKKWRFYAPSLDSQGGTVLADYIASQGYLPFTTSIPTTEGYWINVGTATGQSTVTTTTMTTTITTTTTTMPVASRNYLYLAGDLLTFDDGYLPKAYTLAEFQTQPGISVKWPMFDIAALQFTLTDAGSFSAVANQTVSAAVAITSVETGNQGAIKFFVDGITVAKTGTDLTLSVPTTAVAKVYGIESNGGGEALKDFSSTVAGATVTIGTAAGGLSKLVLGSAINSAVNSLGSAAGLSGTYKVTLVVDSLPLTRADGTPLAQYSVSVPLSLFNASFRTVTGPGIEGYIRLTPR